MSINSLIPCVEAVVKDNGTDLSIEKTTRKIAPIDMTESEQLLGSVTTLQAGIDGFAVRTSARVIAIKTRMDTRAPTPPPDPNLSLPKTPNTNKNQNRAQWTNIERNVFFDALNEFGRDFEQISKYINLKMKRKFPTEIKTKEHVRQLYYQIYQKVSKYLKFSDDVKKPAQELYTLINYGEMKKKLLTLTEKTFLKLRELVYKGSVTVRVKGKKGKNIKIKTPSCRALRKLNNLLDGSLEDVHLPHRVEVILRPSNMEAWGVIQTIAQNPRVKATLPLQKRIACLLQTMQHKWRPQNSRLHEKYLTLPVQQNGRQKISNENLIAIDTDVAELKMNELMLCFVPPKDATIHRPMIQLTEFLSSYSLCLNSYEERICARTRGESLCLEKITHMKEQMKTNAKRLRNDTTILKNEHCDNNITKKCAQLNTISMPSTSVPINVAMTTSKSKKNTMKDNANSFKPLISEEAIKKIRDGWSIKNVADLTVGDLYLMYGSDSKLVLEYYWTDGVKRENESKEEIKTETGRNLIGNKLKQLLSIATMLDINNTMKHQSCSCGHICDKKAKHQSNDVSNDVFKQPPAPRNNTEVNVRPNITLNQPRFNQSRWWRQRNATQQRSRQNTVHCQDLVPPSNHFVRQLYHTPATPQVDVPVLTKKDSSPPKEDLNSLIEEKILKLSQLKHETKSAPKSIFSISPMKLLGENNSMDGEMDNVSLSSFLGHLEHGNRMNNNNNNNNNNNYSNDVNKQIETDSFSFINELKSVNYFGWTKVNNLLIIKIVQFSDIRYEIQSIRNNIKDMKKTINEQAFHYNDKSTYNLHRTYVELSKNVEKSIRVIKDGIMEPVCSNIMFRVKTFQLSLVSQDYLSVYREHISFVDGYEEKLKNILKREAQILSVDITHEETETFLINRESTSMFVDNVLQETQKARNNLRDIIHRHDELENFEKSLKEVFELFLQISKLVSEQGNLIQVVEYHSEQATFNVDKGADNLEKARVLQIKALKKKTCILIWVTSILGALIIIMLIL
ncbi:unnamed protein product [Diamesa serratosioi]